MSPTRRQGFQITALALDSTDAAALGRGRPAATAESGLSGPVIAPKKLMLLTWKDRFHLHPADTNRNDRTGTPRARQSVSARGGRGAGGDRVARTPSPRESGRGCVSARRRAPHGVPARDQLRRTLAGQNEALLASDSLPGDVERRAVVDRHADDREPDRDVHACVAVDRLERRVPLIVIAGDDDVPFPLYSGREQGVGGDRPLRVDAARSGPGYRRREHLGVLMAEEPVLAGVRVQP